MKTVRIDELVWTARTQGRTPCWVLIIDMYANGGMFARNIETGIACLIGKNDPIYSMDDLLDRMVVI